MTVEIEQLSLDKAKEFFSMTQWELLEENEDDSGAWSLSFETQEEYRIEVSSIDKVNDVPINNVEIVTPSQAFDVDIYESVYPFVKSHPDLSFSIEAPPKAWMEFEWSTSEKGLESVQPDVLKSFDERTEDEIQFRIKGRFSTSEINISDIPKVIVSLEKLLGQ